MGPRKTTKSAQARLNLGFGLLLFMILLLGITVVYESYRILSENLVRQQQAADLTRTTGQLQVDLLSMETGKRGFLLSGEQRFLEPYEMGRREFERNLKEARRINELGDRAVVETRDLDSLQKDYESILTFFERQISDRRAGVTDPEKLRLSQGKAEVDDARTILGRLGDQALERRNAARESTRDAVRREILLAVVLVILALLAGIFSLLFVRRGLVTPLNNLREQALETSRMLKNRSSTEDLEGAGPNSASVRWKEDKDSQTTQEIAEVREAFADLVAQLGLQTARVRSLIAGIDDPLLTTDLDGRITYANSAAARLSGYGVEDIRGRDLASLVSEADGSISCMRKAMSSGEPVSGVEEFMHRRDGGEVPVASSCSPLLGEDGSVVGGLKIVRDITGFKRAEREQLLAREAAEEASRSKSDSTLR